MKALNPITGFALLLATASATTPDLSKSFQSVLTSANNNNLYTYPTDLTRGIIPVSPTSPFHHS